MLVTPYNLELFFKQFTLPGDLEEADETIDRIIKVLYEAQQNVRIQKAIKAREKHSVGATSGAGGGSSRTAPVPDTGTVPI